MNASTKSRTSVAKFEEFFATTYKDDVFEILEKYPDERSLTVDYNDLEMFDPDLADLLIEKPEEVIEASKSAICNIDPLVKYANINIRFKNVSNCIPIEKINSNHVGNLITTKIHVKEVNDVDTILKTGVFECRGCMRLHEVEQRDVIHIIEPSLCSECGGRSFRLLQEESKYVDKQIIISSVNGGAYPSIFVLSDDLVSQLKIGDNVTITGILKTYQTNNGSINKYFDVNYLKVLGNEDSEFNLSEVEVRNSKEYEKWRNQVINRDQVCQCCGGHKHLEAHHIFSYKNHTDYRLNPDNGVALCKWCHGKYHSYYGKDAVPYTLIEFCKRFGGL